jgi:hypothetical protein
MTAREQTPQKQERQPKTSLNTLFFHVYRRHRRLTTLTEPNQPPDLASITCFNRISTASTIEISRSEAI